MNRRFAVFGVFSAIFSFLGFSKAKAKEEDIGITWRWVTSDIHPNLVLVTDDIPAFKGYSLARVWDYREIPAAELKKVKFAIERKVYWHFVAYLHRPEPRYTGPDTREGRLEAAAFDTRFCI